MILVLQTNVDHTVDVWLVKNKSILSHKQETVIFPKRNSPLVLIDQLLKQQKNTPKNIKRIIVTRGPGRFSAVRTGLLIANTLSQEQKIPVQGIIKKTTLTDEQVIQLASVDGSSYTAIKPWYGKRPNITKPKKKLKS